MSPCPFLSPCPFPLSFSVLPRAFHMDKELFIVVVCPIVIGVVLHYGLPLLDWSAKFLWKGARLRIENARDKRMADFEQQVQKLLADTTGLASLRWECARVVYSTNAVSFACIAAVFLVLASVSRLSDALLTNSHWYIPGGLAHLAFLCFLYAAFSHSHRLAGLNKIVYEADKRRKEACKGETGRYKEV
jgi:hypothetical protein